MTRRERRLARRRRQRRRALGFSLSAVAVGVGLQYLPAMTPRLATVADALETGTVGQLQMAADPEDELSDPPLARTPSAPAAPGANLPAVVTVPAAVAGQAGTLEPQVGIDDPWVDLTSVGRPYSEKVDGKLTFRGNPTRTFYGRGPVPRAPRILWTYPDIGALCGPTTIEGGTQVWCGTGWTGEAAVWGRGGRTWMAFGAYDHQVHFLDADSGAQLRPPFRTGDIIKGSVTVDPDGYPLLYTGSRDDNFRVIAFDRETPTELWRLRADDVAPTMWNNDWDGSALVLDDYLFEGGENSQFHIVKLNRGYDTVGNVIVDPQLVFAAPGWDAQLLADHGTDNVSIENSVAIAGDTVYFANSGGLVQGWDLSGLRAGADPVRTFRFWTGDDTDASIVVDADGMLYVASEYERGSARSTEVGQIIKLDPKLPEPIVWSVDVMDGLPDGVWGTPAIDRDMVYAGTHRGRLLGIDRATGEVRWEKRMEGKIWPSPVVVDGVLLAADCGGNLVAYDVRDTATEPPLLWQRDLGGCVESTPVVWDGVIYVGTRDGQMLALADQ